MNTRTAQTHRRGGRRTAVLLAVAGLALAVTLTACGDDDDSNGSVDGSPAIQVIDAWARPSPMVASAAAAYMEILNTGDADDALVAASVPAAVAARAELHETRAASGGTAMGTIPSETEMTSSMPSDMGAEGDATSTTTPMMEMAPVERIAVPAGGSATLEPGGYHVMLLELPAPLEDGQEFDLTLTFEGAGEIVVAVVVGDDAP